MITGRSASRSSAATAATSGTSPPAGSGSVAGSPSSVSRTVSEPNVDPFGRERVGIKLAATVDRNEYGVSWNAPNQGGGNYLGDDVTITADLALVKAAA